MVQGEKDKEIARKIGKRIKSHRNERGFSQALLAKNSGISRSYLADVERGEYNPSVSTLMSIAASLGIPSSMLLEDKEVDFDNLFIMCKEKGMDLDALAKFLSISNDALSRIRNKRIPDEESMDKICSYFNCTWDYLIGKTGSPNEVIFGNKSISIPETAEPLNITARIPILGTVAAGYPLYAEQNIIGQEEVPRSLVKGGEYFFLLVQGESMIGSRIYPGDKVLIRRQPEVENGQIALVLVDNEGATLKRIKYVNGNAILYPDNPAYTTQIYPISAVKVIGYVTQVMFDPNAKKNTFS